MNPQEKDPYKFEDPLTKKPSSVAGRRHARHTTTRHPHAILGALAPDAAPSTQQDPNAPPPPPPLPPPKPVSEILPTALPAKESYDEAAIVASTAFQSHYTAPQSSINPILYGSSTNGLAGDATGVVPGEDYNMSMDGSHGHGGSGHKSGVSAVKIVIIVMGMLILLLAISLVAVIIATKK